MYQMQGTNRPNLGPGGLLRSPVASTAHDEPSSVIIIIISYSLTSVLSTEGAARARHVRFAQMFTYLTIEHIGRVALRALCGVRVVTVSYRKGLMNILPHYYPLLTQKYWVLWRHSKAYLCGSALE